MRHDPASAAVVVMLRGLKMFGMAQAVGDLIEQSAPAFDAAVPILSQLLKAEMAEREVRSISYQIKAARFPAYIHRTRRRLGLHHRTLTGPAAIAGPVNAFDAQDGRHHVQHLADILADPAGLPSQQGQASRAGSMVTCTRGRCAGRPPILRAARGRAGWWEFAGRGNFSGSTGCRGQIIQRQRQPTRRGTQLMHNNEGAKIRT
jgi:hypothetical protein